MKHIAISKVFIHSFLILIAISYSSCTNEEDCCSPKTPKDSSFDREAMLTQWAENIIIPAFEDYSSALKDLAVAQDNFAADPSADQLAAMRDDYINAYLAWQSVSLFDIGRAESIALRNKSNIFPTSEEKIAANIESSDYNLELPSNFVAQGLPAIDYLLYGIADEDADILNILSEPNYELYLTTLINRLDVITHDVLTDWKDNYKAEFISNQASSATGSIDKLVNDAIFYYEKFLRAGKIGIPAGVFSGNTIMAAIEAPYSGIYSKEFFDEGLNSFQNFFNGTSVTGRPDSQSLRHYLDYLGAEKDGVLLSELINDQLNKARTAAIELSGDLQNQIYKDNSKMLNTYDELQKAVVLLKVDMLQALNIKVDFVDADGD